jgi:hypothetical protein
MVLFSLDIDWVYGTELIHAARSRMHESAGEFYRLRIAHRNFICIEIEIKTV